MMNETQRKLLVVDDDPRLRDLLQRYLREHQFEVSVAADGAAMSRLLLREKFDLIILDPPKFAPSVHHVDRAARAYKELNLKALRLLNPGGLLFTFSCSGAIGVELFQKIVAGAVFDAGVDAQLLRRLGAGLDHPMQMTHPEGEYLKGLMLRVMG